MPPAPKKQITKLSAIKVNEISLCTEPACPTADIILTKSKDSPGASGNPMMDAATAIQKGRPGLNMTQALTMLALTDGAVNKAKDAPVMLRALEIQGANPQMPFSKCLAAAHTEAGEKSYAAS